MSTAAATTTTVTTTTTTATRPSLNEMRRFLFPKKRRTLFFTFSFQTFWGVSSKPTNFGPRSVAAAFVADVVIVAVVAVVVAVVVVVVA